MFIPVNDGRIKNCPSEIRQRDEGKLDLSGGIGLVPDGREPLGEPVLAGAKGYVVKIITNDSVIGNCIIMLHRSEEGDIYTIYAHLQQVLITKLSVEAGQIIGTIGESGSATEPFLYFGVRNAKWERVDPSLYIT